MIFGIILAKINYSALETMMDSKIEAVSNSLKNVSVDFINNFDYEQLQTFANQTVKDEVIVRVSFYNTDGEVIVTARDSKKRRGNQ